MQHHAHTPGSHDRFFMFVSAVLFAYFGFFTGMTPTTGGGQYVLFFDILLWTLRIGAIGFAIAAMLSFLAPLPASVLYALFGLATSVGLLLVATMDIVDKQHVAAIGPFWAFVFAAFNGYGSWVSLRELTAVRNMHREEMDQTDEPLP